MTPRKTADLRKRLLEIHGILRKTYGEQKCNLEHEDPFQLLVATILSAQCTDKTVNSITGRLFAKYPTVRSFADVPQEELEQDIRQCGYYHAKSANIIAMSRKLISEFCGVVPGEMEKLVTLPGVGRKTANVVLSDAFGVPGFPVDTHVIRLTNLIGIVHTENAEKIESAVCGCLPPELWGEMSHLFISHGRKRCPARRPDCAGCEISKLCDFGRRKENKCP